MNPTSFQTAPLCYVAGIFTRLNGGYKNVVESESRQSELNRQPAAYKAAAPPVVLYRLNVWLLSPDSQTQRRKMNENPLTHTYCNMAFLSLKESFLCEAIKYNCHLYFISSIIVSSRLISSFDSSIRPFRISNTSSFEMMANFHNQLLPST